MNILGFGTGMVNSVQECWDDGHWGGEGSIKRLGRMIMVTCRYIHLAVTSKAEEEDLLLVTSLVMILFLSGNQS